jgi:hypothetical protein
MGQREPERFMQPGDYHTLVPTVRWPVQVASRWSHLARHRNPKSCRGSITTLPVVGEGVLREAMKDQPWCVALDQGVW